MSTLIAFIDVRTLASAEANNNKSFYFISICGHTPIRIGDQKNSRRFECFTAFFHYTLTYVRVTLAKLQSSAIKYKCKNMFQLKTNIRIEKRWREKMHERKKTKCQNFRHCISADIFEAAKHFMHRHTYATHHTKQWHYVLLAIDRKFSYLAKVIVELCVVIFANTETTFYSGLHLCKIMYKSYLHRKPSGTNASEQWFLWSLSTSLLLYPSLSLSVSPVVCVHLTCVL